MSQYLGKLGVGRMQSPSLHGKMVILFSVAFLLDSDKLHVHGVPFLPTELRLDNTPPHPLCTDGAEEAYLRGV